MKLLDIPLLPFSTSKKRSLTVVVPELVVVGVLSVEVDVDVVSAEVVEDVVPVELVVVP